nr:unnamed protein product [Digitaria exilis]
MKLLVDTNAGRVIYAEAGKDVVDFLFSLLTLLVATVVKRLDAAYVNSAGAKTALAGRRLQASSSSLAAALAPVTAVKVYQCSDGCSDDCYNYVAVVKNTPCRLCHGPMNEPMEVVGSSDPSSGGHGEAAAEDGQGQAPDAVLAGMGFVQVVVTYTIMDDLAVAPMSTISGIAVLRGFGVTDLGSLQEKAVRCGDVESVAAV